MLPVVASDMFDKIRSLLNDSDDQMFHNDDILPLFQIAYDDLRLAVQNYNIPISNVTSERIVLPAGVTGLGGNNQLPLPTDLVEILSINERPGGTANDYIMMRRRAFLPLNETQTAYLGIWSWQNQQVKFIGATGDVDLKINYIADTLGTIIDEDSVLTYYNCKNYLQYRTAALCAGNIGENESRRDQLNSEATMVTDLLLQQGIKTQQSIVTRRRGYGQRRRNGWW